LTPDRPFLTAAWRDLVMLNYEIDPSILAGRVPDGCAIDDFEGRTFVSVVGFRFLDTRVLGVPIPFHRNFEEVNLRFYVRREADGTRRRGVVFVKEIVPLAAIAEVARRVYGENYVALPMRHAITGAGADRATVAYHWRRSGSWEGVAATCAGPPALPEEGSEEAFIAEHYWGYSRQPDGGTIEYQVEHPRWRVRRAATSGLDCDATSLYGAVFAAALAGAPSSAFVAEGSDVVVHRGRKLPASGRGRS
jgi:uncharacterized protein